MRHLLFLLLLCPGLSWGETLFVQSQKMALKAEANMAAADVMSLVRGDEVSVLETQGTWLKVQKGDKAGWVSKLFVSKNKPVGAATLAQEVTASEAKTSRRRESSYSVSASTRGLMPIQRSRTGRESYQSDNEALESINARQISEADVGAFIKSSELGR